MTHTTLLIISVTITISSKEVAGSYSKWPLDPDFIWQHISCKQRWVIFASVWWRHLATLLRGRDDSFGNTLLKIAKTHTISCLRVRTLTIKSGDVPPWTCSGTYPPPPPVNQTLSRHDVIWQPTVTVNSDESLLCRQYDVIWQHYCVGDMTFISMTYPLRHVQTGSSLINVKAM